MMDGEMIMTSVMDVWCCFLNALEELRAPVSPYRLFCYIETTVSIPSSMYTLNYLTSYVHVFLFYLKNSSVH